MNNVGFASFQFWIRRFAAVGLLGVVLAAGIYSVAATLDYFFVSERRELQSLQERVQRLKAHEVALLKSGALSKSVSSDNYSQHFLRGVEDSLILADLQTRLRSMIVSRNGELVSSRNLPPKKDGEVVKIGLNLQLRTDMRNMQEVLHLIESGTPYLWISRATLRLDDRRGIQINGQQQGPRVLADIDVYGAKWEKSVSPRSNGGRS